MIPGSAATTYEALIEHQALGSLRGFKAGILSEPAAWPHGGVVKLEAKGFEWFGADAPCPQGLTFW